jgi:hypothetical protein
MEKPKYHNWHYLIIIRLIMIKVYFFAINVIPYWYSRATFDPDRRSYISIGPRAVNRYRYRRSYIHLIWLIFEIEIPYWRLTEEGKHYPKDYDYEKDPDGWQTKLDEFQKECEF